MNAASQRVSLWADGTQDVGEIAGWCASQGIELDIQSGAPNVGASTALCLDQQGLCLYTAGFDTPFRLQPGVIQRRSTGAQLLARACGDAGGWLLDAFAGFGLDGFLLARKFRLTLVEGNPLVYLMLRDFGRRSGIQADFIYADARQVVSGLTTRPEVIYLDPMFEARNKRALPNRGLQHLRALTAGTDVDMAQMLELARDRAGSRVVMKRRRKSEAVGRPTFAIRGKTVRYDVYC